MATLTSTKIKNTYDALLKSIDNDAIGITAKQITDGLGNTTPLYVSTTQVGIGVTPESGLNLHVFGDAKIGSNLTVIGNLVVEGSTTTVGTDTLTVKDPLIVLANNNTSTDAVDIGFYGKYTPSGTTLYSGLFREALTGKYRLFKGLEVEPTTTVNTSGTGYAKADLVIGALEATTGTFSGNVDIDGTLDVDDVISVEGSAFGRIEIGGASGGYVDLKAPNSDDYDLRLITSVGGAELLSIDTLKFYTGATTDLAFTIDASQNATFENNVTIPETPTADTHAASKGYVDAAVEGQDTLAEILANGNTSGANDIIMADDQRINFGTSNAFNLRWSTTAASGQGASIIDSNRIFIETNFFQLNSRTGESMIRATSNSDVELYYDDSKKLETTSTGITVTGTVSATAFSGNITGGTISGTTGTFTDDLVVDTDTLFVDASEDSVGIGLTNPADYTADELVISVPDGSGMTLVSGTTDAAYITFMSSTGAIATNGGYIGYDHDADGLTMFAQSKVSIAILEAEVAYFTDTAFYVDKSTTIDDNLSVSDDLGVGISVPLYKLDVVSSAADTARFTSTSSTTTNVYIGNSNATANNTANLYFMPANNIAGSYIKSTAIEDFSTAANRTSDLRFGVRKDGTFNEAVIIDSSGNVGIGVTPSTIWSTSYDALQIGLGGSIYAHSSAGNALKLGSNIVYEGTAPNYYDKYLSSSTATKYEQDSGSHIWSTASSGTAGNAVSWTESMRIDSSGNVGINETSPDALLDIELTDTNTYSSTALNTATLIAQTFNTSNVNSQASVISLRTTGWAGGTTGVVNLAAIQAGNANSAHFVVQTRNAGTYGERMRIESGGQAIFYGDVTLDSDSTKVKLGDNQDLQLYHDGSNSYIETTTGSAGDLYIRAQGTNHDLYLKAADEIAFSTASSERMRIDSSGTTRLLKTQVTGSFDTTSFLRLHPSTTINNGGFTNMFFGTSELDNFGISLGGLRAGTDGTPTFIIKTHNNDATGVERMRITSGGNVLIGCQSLGNTHAYFEQASNSRMVLNLGSSTTSDSTILVFRNPNGGVGSVRTNGSATSYITSSDYRLKENVVEMTGALDRVSQLKPSRFNFIADADKTVDGFLAHEVQEIVPEAITGEKDGMRTEEYEVSPAVYEDVVHPAEEAVYETVEHPAVEEELDDEGNVVVEAVEAYTEEVLVTEAKEEWTEKVLVSEKVMGTREVPDYQGIDQSKLVPLLVGAIQEQQQLINDLKNRIETLENN